METSENPTLPEPTFTQTHQTFIQTYQKIIDSTAFQTFQKDHPDAELVAGFFILDFLDETANQRALDFKDKEQIFTFSLNQQNEITLKEDKLIETTTHPQLTKIQPETKVELNELKSIVGTKALDEGVKDKFQKIIAVLQKHGDKQIWNLTCMLENMVILNILIDCNTEEIIKFDKKNMMDFIKQKK